MADAPADAGWYADPTDLSRLRLWDGEQWTRRVRELEPLPRGWWARARVPTTVPFWAVAVVVIAAVGAGVVVGRVWGSGGSSRDPRIVQLTTEVPPTPEAATAPTTPAGAAGAVELLANTNGAGDATLGPVTAGAGWTLGWAFTCAATGNGTGSFEVVVESPDGGPAVAEVRRDGSVGDGTEPVTAAGTYRIRVRADAPCQWAVKATGPPA